MKLMVISVATDVLGTIPKILMKEVEDLKIRGLVETILTTALLLLIIIMTARIL